MGNSTQEQFRTVLNRREKKEKKQETVVRRPSEGPKRTPEERKKVVDQRRETVKGLMQGQFPGEKGRPGFDRTLRTFIKTNKDTLKKAGIHGTKEQQEREVRKIMFGDAMDRLTTREQQIIRGVSDAYKVDGNLLATIRDLGVDGFGYGYDRMKRKDVGRQLLEAEMVAQNIRGSEKDLAAILIQDISPKEKRRAIEELIRKNTKNESILDGIEDELERPDRTQAQLQRIPKIPKGIAKSVQRGYQPNPRKETTYGYSRSKPSPRGGGSYASPSETVSTESLRGINATGKGKQVIDTVTDALQRKNIRGEHCWNWCEKVYRQAGARRSGLYSNFKTGRNDRNTGFNSKSEVESKIPGGLQPGDWLFVKNHNKSDTYGNHSVIFLGWEGNKVRTANCPKSGSTGHISSYDVADCPIVWISRAV